jgi:hypothetical protein
VKALCVVDFTELGRHFENMNDNKWPVQSLLFPDGYLQRFWKEKYFPSMKPG